MHTDSPETSVAMVADVQPPTGLRRRLIGAGLIGLAGSLAPRLASRVSASVPEDSTDSTDDTTDNTDGPEAPDNTAGGSNNGETGDTTPAATTTTASPKQPTGDDATLLGFAQSFELAAVQLYGVALASGSLSETTLSIVTSVHQSHVSYAQSLNALLGRKAPGEALPDATEMFGEDFGGDEDAFLTAAYTLEDTAVATHTDLIEQLQGTDGAALLASILIVEAEHATVFADLAGETDLDTLILTSAEALVPAEG